MDPPNSDNLMKTLNNGGLPNQYQAVAHRYHVESMNPGAPQNIDNIETIILPW